MQGKELLRLVDSLHRNKEIDEETIFQAIERALESAARKHFGQVEEIKITIDRETGEVTAVRGAERIEPEMLGRIAAQTAKQIFIQGIREAESETIYTEYIGRVGALVTGSVQRFEGGAIIVNLERAEAILPRSEQIPGEHYQAGERIRAIIMDVRKANNLVKIFLSRTSPEFIKRLFELEVPEVAEGVVQIRKLARDPGLRTKVAVESLDPRVDCIGACVGVRGTRIKSIIDEVKGEKIDIIPWSDVPEPLLAASLKPAEIHQITLVEGLHTKRATVVVPEDQLSLAIGWKGQNVRLAVKMTGWDIDIVLPELTAEQKAAAEAKAAAARDAAAALVAEDALAANAALAAGADIAAGADLAAGEAVADAEGSDNAEEPSEAEVSAEAGASIELAEEQSEAE